MMAKLKRGHYTVHSTVLAAPPATVKDKGGEAGDCSGLDQIIDGVQPDVLQRGRAVMACQGNKSQDVRAATWNVSCMVGRSGEVVVALHRRKIGLCCAQETMWKGGSARMFGAIDRRVLLAKL